jgi:hypothetical protein
MPDMLPLHATLCQPARQVAILVSQPHRSLPWHCPWHYPASHAHHLATWEPSQEGPSRSLTQPTKQTAPPRGRGPTHPLPSFHCR